MIIQDTAREIAQHLPGFRLADDDRGFAHSARLAGPDGQRLKLFFSDLTEQLVVLGMFPDGPGRLHGIEAPRLEIDRHAARTGAAALIARLLLPGYVKDLAAVVAAHAAEQRRLDAQRAVVDRLAAAAPGAVVTAHSYFKTPEGFLVVAADSRVTLELYRLPADLAEQVLRLVASVR